MSEASIPLAGGNPFSPRAALALVLFGAIVFIALLWMIGAGMTGGNTNDGGSHAGGKGLNGYAALADFLERRDFLVRRSQSEAAFEAPELLVLTPPADADPKDLDRIVAARRTIGPTLVVTPKWRAFPVPAPMAKGKRGWVQLGGAQPVEWPGFRDDLSLGVSAGDPRWSAGPVIGTLPSRETVQSGSGVRLVPLAVTREGRLLAGYIDDGGMYPGLEGISVGGPVEDADEEDVYPLVMVFEPDLLDNWGMASKANALFADRLFHAIAYGGMTINFDLTLQGHVRSANLLTLAFTPPFLAATFCLLLAALVAGWRAFLRFGPPRVAGRAIAFGKRALVANTAGLIRRARRLHLVGAPYVAAARERLVHALALPRAADSGTTEALIDRALAARGHEGTTWSAAALRLRRARRAHDIVAAAKELHMLERILSR